MINGTYSTGEVYTYTYTYNVVGNRQIQDISGTVTAYDYDAINRMISSTVSGQSAVGYTWDAENATEIFE